MTDKIPAWALVNLGGKDYELVASRIQRFREKHPDYTIKTKVVVHERGDGSTITARAEIRNDEGQTLSTGSSAVHGGKPNAYELAETKAVGRALAFFGFGGQHIASAEEMQEYSAEERESDLLSYNDLWREFRIEISTASENLFEARAAFEAGETEKAAEIAREVRDYLDEALGRDNFQKLWRAPTKGGCFETWERAYLKSGPPQSDTKRDPDGRGV